MRWWEIEDDDESPASGRAEFHDLGALAVVNETRGAYVQFPPELSRIENPDYVAVLGVSGLYYDKRTDVLRDFDPDRDTPRFRQIARWPEHVFRAAMRTREVHRGCIQDNESPDRQKQLPIQYGRGPSQRDIEVRELQLRVSRERQDAQHEKARLIADLIDQKSGLLKMSDRRSKKIDQAEQKHSQIDK